MPKKKIPGGKQTGVPYGFDAFKKLLERTTDTLETRVVGRITEELNKKPDREELTKKADKTDVEAIRRDAKELKELIVDRYLEIHKKTHQQIEQRLSALESSVSSN